MKKLLETFFYQIAKIHDASVQELSPKVYAVYSKEFKSFEYQASWLQDHLTAYGLSGTVTIEAMADGNTRILFDFARAEKQLPDMATSHKFLVDSQQRWNVTELDTYCTFMGSVEPRDPKHILLACNFCLEAPQEWSCEWDTADLAVFFTYDDGTVLYLPANKRYQPELKQAGRYSNYHYRQAKTVLHTYSVWQLPKALLQVNRTGQMVGVDEARFSKLDLLNQTNLPDLIPLQKTKLRAASLLGYLE